MPSAGYMVGRLTGTSLALIRSAMTYSDAIPLVRCRLDGPEDEPSSALRYVLLAEFDLWQYLMEGRHRRRVTIESISVWIPDVAARGMWVLPADVLEPVFRVRLERPGLRPQHLAAIRAAALACGARVGGAFDGSPDVRFEPGPLAAGDFRFEIATAGAVTLVLQTVLLPLATAAQPSRVEVTGGTHVPASPSFHYLEKHWRAVVERLGVAVTLTLARAGFHPPGGG